MYMCQCCFYMYFCDLCVIIYACSMYTSICGVHVPSVASIHKFYLGNACFQAVIFKVLAPQSQIIFLYTFIEIGTRVSPASCYIQSIACIIRLMHSENVKLIAP